jgi:hypothetical protein
VKPLYRILLFEVLVGGDILLLWRGFTSAPTIYIRLFTIFVAGAVTALFVQGPVIGAMPPNSTRPLMVVLGVVLMGTSVVWTLAIRGHV